MNRSTHAIVLAGSLLACAADPSVARAQARVEITGGPDEGGHHYTWTVTNHADQPIVSLEFTHYQADLFTTPPGWTAAITHPTTDGPGEEGLCIATAKFPAAHIKPGASAACTLRLGPAATTWGVRHAEGDVRVTFADGSTVTVTAPAPRKESVLGRQTPFIGLATIIILLVAVRARRRRTRQAPGPTTNGQS